MEYGKGYLNTLPLLVTTPCLCGLKQDHANFFKDPVRLALLFTRFYLDSSGLLDLPRRTGHSNLGSGACPLSAPSLRACVGELRLLFEYVLSLTQAQMMCFCTIDWTRVILAIILALRLSFPVPECPDWDAAWARSMLGFDDFLITMSLDADLAPSSKKADLLSAFRVVIRVIKEKYERRLARPSTSTGSSSGSGCPMVDGSLDHFIPLWDAPLDVSSVPGLTPSTDEGTVYSGPVFNDLWATMTMEWANCQGMFESSTI